MPPKKLLPGSAVTAENINDDSDLMTEQSSLSDFTVNNETEKDTDDSIQPNNKIDSQQEALEYTEMEIEDPPSFLNSQYAAGSTPCMTMKTYLKRLPGLKNDDDNDLDDVFQKKNEPRRFSQSDSADDQASSKSGTRRNRKPRKPREPRKPRGSKNKNTLFNWQQKPNDSADNKIQKGQSITGFFGRDQQTSNVQESGQGDDDMYTSDSSASRSTIIPEEKPQKKVLKHITIALDDDEEEKEEKEIPAVQKEVVHEVIQIGGVNVKFPVKPYPSQMAVMSKLIQGCKKSEHCLLESPTGSGKTLALLCGVLAWQEHMEEELRQRNVLAIEKAQEQIKAELERGAQSSAVPIDPSKKGQSDEPSTSRNATKCCNADEFIEFSEDDDQAPALKKICRSTSPGSMREFEELNFVAGMSDDQFLKDFDEEEKAPKLPTIYYGSRTHKQIEQVIRELKKTAYAYKNMTILSSREFSCIQNTDRNKTEVCNRLLDPTKHLGCQYHNENNRKTISTNRNLDRFGINGPWDIEDLVKIGREQGACPYFAARDLMIEADIVFCPYNYLVDPNIRQSMQIQLEGQIVILDEAHNVEEMSREVGSLAFREDKITEFLQEIQTLCSVRKQDFETYNQIKIYLNKFLQFIRVNNLNTVDKFSETSSSDFWTGVQLCELFNIHLLGKGHAKTFETAAAAAIMDFNSAKEAMAKKQHDKPQLLVITQVGKRFLEDLVMALQMMSSEKLANDYRACIVEANVRDFSKTPDNTSTSRGPTERRLRTLQMLCMNPAVIFSPLANLARSVILASGTLSPISSFQSELGTLFRHKLDANHVVPKESVYIRGIPCGPTGVQLKANYVNVNSWNFQDELGKLVLNVCRAIPHGVLCFFSSYSMMQKQIDRWKQNSCWDELERVKWVLQEPRGSSNLEPVMQEFRDIIQATSENPQKGGITGALLLAVFRGKVAEGIDFSDNEARCVMAVGIPYAVRKDPSVDMKYTYNDLNQAKGLLRGGEWYTVQAFRALNQALGRCLRHRNDWGAVLLIDQRFLERTNYNYLPKWVKTMWRDSVRYNLTQELEQFVAVQVERTKQEKLDSASL